MKKQFTILLILFFILCLFPVNFSNAGCSLGQGRPCHIQSGSDILRGMQWCTNLGLWGECEIEDPPVLTEVVPVASPTSDNTPEYTFYSTKEGAIAWEGVCKSATTRANVGNNIVIFNELPDGYYDQCSLRIQDAVMYLSESLHITPFTVGTVPTFLLEWGRDGLGDGEFYSAPYGVDIGSQGNVYVLDGRRIQKFNSQGVFITKSAWGTGGTGLAIDSQDNVYVTNLEIANTVKKFDSDLNLLGTIYSEVITISPGFGFKDIAIDSSDNLFIAGRWKVVKMDTNGNIIKEWGSRCGGDGAQSTEVLGTDSQGNVCLAGQFADAQAIGVDNYDNVYVLEYWLHHVQVFDNDGNYIKRWGGVGSEDGKFRTPFGGAFDSENYIYIADFYNHRVQKLTSEGIYLTQWGSSGGAPGSEPGEFYYPRDVTVGPDDSIYVADSGNYRIQKFAYVPACTSESWSCTNWSVCSQYGSQTRSCSKISNCEGGVSSPATRQSCWRLRWPTRRPLERLR